MIPFSEPELESESVTESVSVSEWATSRTRFNCGLSSIIENSIGTRRLLSVAHRPAPVSRHHRLVAHAVELSPAEGIAPGGKLHGLLRRQLEPCRG